MTRTAAFVLDSTQAANNQFTSNTEWAYRTRSISSRGNDAQALYWQGLGPFCRVRWPTRSPETDPFFGLDYATYNRTNTLV